MPNNYINWKKIYQQPALFHIYLTERKRGKSDTKGWTFLEEIIKKPEIRFAWIRRRWHDNLLSTKSFFEDLVYKFVEEKNLNLNHFEIKERGLSYQGTKRIDFYDLFSYQRARGAIARTVYQEIVFEEAIPIDQEFLYVGGRTEQWIFKDLVDSLKGRKGKNNQSLKTKITFLANPYLFSAWFLDVFPNLHKLRKLAEEKKTAKDNSGVLEIARDENGIEWLLYLNLIEGEFDPHSKSLEEKVNPSRVNWDDFMVDEPKKYQIVYAIQDFFFCEVGERKELKEMAGLHSTFHVCSKCNKIKKIEFHSPVSKELKKLLYTENQKQDDICGCSEFISMKKLFSNEPAKKKNYWPWIIGGSLVLAVIIGGLVYYFLKKKKN